MNAKEMLGQSSVITIGQTKCQPAKGQRCIPDVVLKNEGSMVQTCRKINEHVTTMYFMAA